MSDILDKLAENRVPILLAEIGAYLHLIGRFSEIFIYAQAEDTTNAEKSFDYKKVCNDPTFFEGTGLDGLLKDKSWEILINVFKNLSNAGELLSSKIKSFSEFIEKHTWGDKPKGLCKILADSHGIVSGIDKALAGRGESGKQRKVYTFEATAFGYEKEIELIGSADLNKIDENRINNIKKESFGKIKEILEKVKQNQNISFENYLEFVSAIEEYYLKTIGETRRPINEISLYDYAHTIASLMKSNLAKMIIDGWYEPKGKSKWRILKINIDVLGLLSKGLKIGDILGYRSEIEEAYKAIKKVIEFECPLGNEIYRDSTGIYFSCPDVNDISKLKSEIINRLKGLNKLDFSLQIEISDESRSMVILASEREESSKRISYPHIGDTENLEKEFEESRNAGGEDICPICRIRLKPEREDRCKKCGNQYQERAKIWIKNPQETIWLDEVADKNDRVALIVGQFDLRKWLSGEFVDTFVSQTFDEWKDVCVDRDCTEKVSDICSRLNIENISDLKKGFENLFNNPKSLDDNWKKICGSFIGIRPKDYMNGFWNPIAERDATGKTLTLTDNSEKAKYLIKLLFRKHPSLARIYRIWNTTQEFINETIFEKILKEYNWNSESRRQRIQFKIEPNPDVPKGVTCDIDVDGVRFSPVCIDRQNGIFVSTINLEILKKFGESVNEISENLNRRIIKVKTEKDRTWKSEKNGKSFKIEEARPVNEKFQNYLLYVKIYDFPDQFMVLVPAYEALDIAKRILDEYEIQFSKVRDRLPFHLGIIAFHRRTPLYVVMDAGKRLLEAFKRKTKTELAEVISVREVEDENLGKGRELTIKVESHSSIPLKWRIFYSTGDPDQEDFWHPYIRFDGDVSDRNLCFDYTGNGDYVVHVKEINENDKIKIESSYFRLTYLENAADRFRVDEDLKPLDYIYYLKNLWKEIENNLKSKTWS
ncbi:CRISPR-associated protein Csx11, partial [Candidatus Woesearchaeota archaeon]